MLAGTLQTAFQPKDNQSQTQVTLTLPPGSKFEQTYALAEQARAIVMQNPEVTLVYTAIGGGTTGGNAFEPSRRGGSAHGHAFDTAEAAQGTRRKAADRRSVARADDRIARRARQGRAGLGVRTNTRSC